MTGLGEIKFQTIREPPPRFGGARCGGVRGTVWVMAIGPWWNLQNGRHVKKNDYRPARVGVEAQRSFIAKFDTHSSLQHTMHLDVLFLLGNKRSLLYKYQTTPEQLGCLARVT